MVQWVVLVIMCSCRHISEAGTSKIKGPTPGKGPHVAVYDEKEKGHVGTKEAAGGTQTHRKRFSYLNIVYGCSACMDVCAYRGQERELDPLELEFQMVVTHHVCAGN